MSYYGDGMSYYYGGPFSNHSSLMTGTGRVYTPLRFAPHLSTISESPLSGYRRYAPVIPSRPKRIIDTADIDVSSPRTLHTDHSRPGNRLRRDRPTIRIRSQALKDNPNLREHNERHEKTVGELLREKFYIKDKKTSLDAKKSHQSLHLASEPLEDPSEAPQGRLTRRMTRRRSSADIQMDPDQLERELAIAQVQAEVLDNLVAEEQAEIEVEVRRGTLVQKSQLRSGVSKSESETDKSEDTKLKIPKKIKKKRKTSDKPSPPLSTPPSSSSQTDDAKESGKVFKVEACNSVGDFSTILLKDKRKIEEFRESIRLPPPSNRIKDDEEVIVLPIKKPYINDNSRNSVYLTLKQQIAKSSERGNDVLTNHTSSIVKTDHVKKESLSKPANIRSKDRSEGGTEVVMTGVTDDVVVGIIEESSDEKGQVIVGENKLMRGSEDLLGVVCPGGDQDFGRDGNDGTGGVGEHVDPVSFGVSEDLGGSEGIVINESAVGNVEQVLIRDLRDVGEDMGIEGICGEGKIQGKDSKIGDQQGDEILDDREAELVDGIGEKNIKKSLSERNNLVESGSDEILDQSETLSLQAEAEMPEKVLDRKLETSNIKELPEKPKRLISKYKYSSTESVTLPSMSPDPPKPKAKSKISSKSKFLSADSGIGSVDLAVDVQVRKMKKKILQNSKGSSFECDEEVKSKISESSEVEKIKPKKPVKKLKKKLTTSKSLPLPLDNPSNLSKDRILSRLTSQEKSFREPFKSLKSFPLSRPEPKLLAPVKEDEKSEQEIDFWSEIQRSDTPKIEPSLNLQSLNEVINKVKLNTETEKEEIQKENVKLPEAIFENSLSSENSSERNCETSVTTGMTVLLSGVSEIQSEVPGNDSLVGVADIVEAASTNVLATTTEDEGSEPVVLQVSKENNEDKIIDQVSREVSDPSTSLVEASLVVDSQGVPEVTKDYEVPEVPETSEVPEVLEAYEVSEVLETSKVLEVPRASEVDEVLKTSEVPEVLKTSEVHGAPKASEVPEIQQQNLDILEEDDEDDSPMTPTNESTTVTLSKWNKTTDLTALDVKNVPSSATETVNEVTTPKVLKKKLSRRKKSGSEDTFIRRVPEKMLSSAEILKNNQKKNIKMSPPKVAKRPVDLNKMFYTTPSSLLTATPRDLSKVKRVKVKKEKYPVRTPSASSDSTGSTRSSQDNSSRSNSTEVEDEAGQKRISSTRSNDSGFDGSPRLSNCDMACHKKCEKLTGNLCGLNQKLVAEALQALKRAPSQSSDNQRNSDSSDHVHGSGRITPPATNLPRFKKYTVEDFHFLKVLGKGSFGKVLLAELRGTDCVYAVKCLKKDVVLEDDDVECTLIERKVLTLATRHPYLCHLFCTFQTDSHLFFVMEYLNGGDLMFHIQKSGRFPEFRARFYAGEIWSGLNFLHKKGIVYRDLKLDNVLLDFEGHIRIADFGMCKLQIFLDRTADTFCGTPDYMAPEIIKGLKYNQAVDWWSFGVLLYEMLTGQSPFSGCDEDELFWSICNERPFIPRYLSQEAMDILVSLLEKDAGKRPMGHDIQAHAFFHSLSWDRLERRLLEPPFKPALDHTLDTRYFDTAFTAEKPRLTPVPEQILTSMDQGVFRGFSYTNPNATD